MLNLGTITTFLGLDVGEFKKGAKDATDAEKQLDAQIRSLTRATDSQQKVCMAAAKAFGVITGVVKEFSPEAARATSAIQSMFAGFAQGGPFGLAVAGINALAMELVNIYKAYDKWNKDQIAAAQAAAAEHQRILDIKKKITDEDQKSERAWNEKWLGAAAALDKEVEAAEKAERVLELQAQYGMSAKTAGLTQRAEELETKLRGRDDQTDVISLSLSSQLDSVNRMISIQNRIEKNTYDAARALEREQRKGWGRAMGVDVPEYSGFEPRGENELRGSLRGLGPETTLEEELAVYSATDESMKRYNDVILDSADNIAAVNSILALQGDVVDDNLAKQKKNADRQDDIQKAAISGVEDVAKALEKGADMILDAAGKLWDETGGRVADAAGEMFQGTGFDKVADEAIASFVGPVGAVIGLILAVGAAISGLMAAIAGAAIAIGVATGAITAGAGAILGALVALAAAGFGATVAIVAFGAALAVALPAAFFAASMVIAKLATDTEAFANIQKVLKGMYDQLVSVLEPIVVQFYSLLPLFQMIVDAVAPFVGAFAAGINPVVAVFNALKVMTVGVWYTVAAYYKVASAATSLEAALYRAAAGAAATLLQFDLAEQFNKKADNLWATADRFDKAATTAESKADAAWNMSIEGAQAAGQAMVDAANATDKYRDSVENMPRWYHFNQTREEETRGNAPPGNVPPSEQGLGPMQTFEAAVSEAAAGIIAAIYDAMSGNTNVYVDSVQASDPKGLLTQLQDYAKKRNVAKTGASYNGDKAYNTGG